LISREYFTQHLGNTHFSSAPGTFHRIEHILGHKASLNKVKKIKITPYIISGQKGMELELDNERNSRKYSNTCRLKNNWVTDVIRQEIEKFLDSSENENTIHQNLWDTTKAMLNGKFILISAYI
jgi:hypothetical protein